MSVMLVVGVAALLVFAGVLLGWGAATGAYDQRSRRQAAFQSRLNDEWQALRRERETGGLDLYRWRALGGEKFDYDVYDYDD